MIQDIPQNDKDFAEFLKKYEKYKNISDDDKMILSYLINTPGTVRRDRMESTSTSMSAVWSKDENGMVAGLRYQNYAKEFAYRSHPVLKNFPDSPIRLLALKMIQEDIYLSTYARLSELERTRTDRIVQRGPTADPIVEQIDTKSWSITVDHRSIHILTRILETHKIEIKEYGRNYVKVMLDDKSLFEKIAIEFAEMHSDNVSLLLRNLSSIFLEVFSVGTCPICGSGTYLCHITKTGDLICENGHIGELKLKKEKALKEFEKGRCDYIGYATIKDGALYPCILVREGSDEKMLEKVYKSRVLDTLKNAINMLKISQDKNWSRKYKNRFIRINVDENVLAKIHYIYSQLQN